MIQNILSHLGGVEHFGIVSLCLFCTVFIGVLFWTFLQNKSHLEYMARVALDQEFEGIPRRFGATTDGIETEPRRFRSTTDESENLS